MKIVSKYGTYNWYRQHPNSDKRCYRLVLKANLYYIAFNLLILRERKQ